MGTDNRNAEIKAYKKKAKVIQNKLLIQPKDIYNNWLVKLDERFKLCKKERSDLLNNKTYLLTRVVKTKTTLVKKDYDLIIHSRNIKDVELLKKYKLSDIMLINYRAIITINIEISKRDVAMKLINSLAIPYKTWYAIIKEYNDSMIKAVVEDGYKLNMHRAGQLYIRPVFLSKPEFDRANSFKKRKEIIAQGKIPWSNEHPDGEDWKVYRNVDVKYKWEWKRKHASIPHTYDYSHIPTRGKTSMIKKLFTWIAENPNHVIKYH